MVSHTSNQTTPCVQHDKHAFLICCHVCALRWAGEAKGGECTQAECARARKGLALPRARNSCEIALLGKRRLRSMLAAAPAVFVHAVVTVTKNSTSAGPTVHPPPLSEARISSDTYHPVSMGEARITPASQQQGWNTFTLSYCDRCSGTTEACACTKRPSHWYTARSTVNAKCSTLAAVPALFTWIIAIQYLKNAYTSVLQTQSHQ